MRLQISAPLSIMASIASVLVVVVMIAIDRSEATIRWAKEKQMTEVAAQIEATLRQTARTATAQAELLAGIPGVGQGVAQEDSEWLKGLTTVYQRQRAKYGVESATFVRPPAKVLLRLHDLNRSGDDQSTKRPLLVAVNRLHEPQGGLEITPNTVGMRGVAPISFNGDHVGAVEWGVGLFRIAQEIHDVTHAEVTFFLQRSRVEGNRTAEERRLGAMAGMVSTDWELTSSLLTLSDLEETNSIKIGYVVWRETEYAAVHVPLFDFSGQRVGTVVAINEINEFSRAASFVRAILISAMVVGVLLCGGVVLIVVRGMLLRPMVRLSERATGLSKGDYSSRVADTERSDEIGHYATALETLRHNLLRRVLPPFKENTTE